MGQSRRFIIEELQVKTVALFIAERSRHIEQVFHLACSQAQHTGHHTEDKGSGFPVFGLEPNHRLSARTTEVSTWREGTDQYS